MRDRKRERLRALALTLQSKRASINMGNDGHVGIKVVSVCVRV